MAIQRTIVML